MGPGLPGAGLRGKRGVHEYRYPYEMLKEAWKWTVVMVA